MDESMDGGKKKMDRLTDEKEEWVNRWFNRLMGESGVVGGMVGWL